MKKLLAIVVAAVVLTGCVPAPEPFCKAYVKSYGHVGEEHYALDIREARTVGYRFPKTQLRTKFGWWDLSQFDLKYGDCKFKLERSGHL
ncbi:hypothetical protein NGS8_1420 [Escherichia coli phage NG_S8]|uniref:Receptor-blocking protein n=2 Tax=Epseptimavirus TaxID=2732017 RepID=A0A5C2IFM8_9CAUD|nr:Cor superinfection exclusion protein [Salmonella phage 1-23]YP_009852344.1 Cor superinfection exclusion protein [Salmonella phage 1-29]QIN92614.1 hypothetical protein [Phage NBSal002]BEU76668.1 hypothetical protein NGS8_1420 [Escherichia coli phage NG_S8]QAX92246.1 receptor-blocking protein [Salmonella phage 1-23]QEP52784.1 receptor-blocking protein [Salmonella phage 1-29]